MRRKIYLILYQLYLLKGNVIHNFIGRVVSQYLKKFFLNIEIVIKTQSCHICTILKQSRNKNNLILANIFFAYA